MTKLTKTKLTKLANVFGSGLALCFPFVVFSGIGAALVAVVIAWDLYLFRKELFQ